MARPGPLGRWQDARGCRLKRCHTAPRARDPHGIVARVADGVAGKSSSPERSKVAPLPDGFLENELEQNRRQVAALERQVDGLRADQARAETRARDACASEAAQHSAIAAERAELLASLEAARGQARRAACYAVMWALLAVGSAAVATVSVKTRLQLSGAPLGTPTRAGR